MSIKIIKDGDLLELLEEDKVDLIIHQTNCFQTLGKGTASGIAAAIGNIYPETKEADLSYKEGDINQLGKFIICPVKLVNSKDSGKLVVNLYSQYHPGPIHGVPTHYGAMASGLTNLANTLPKNTRIGLYLLGTNRGGACKNKVMEIITSTLKDFNLTITS